MNTFCLTGRLGKDAELKTLNSGQVLCSFSVAFDAGYGERKKSHWLNCQLWGKRGESLAQYLKKGTMVALVGELSAREYDRQDGSKGHSLELNVSDVTLCGGKPQGQAQGQEQAPAASYVDDQIPF